MTAIRTLPLAAAALMMLGACVVQVPVEEPAPSACRPADVPKLIGQINPSEEIIRAVSGASTVRQAGPNQPMTMDFRYERATIVKDPLTGRVIQATCG